MSCFSRWVVELFGGVIPKPKPNFGIEWAKLLYENLQAKQKGGDIPSEIQAAVSKGASIGASASVLLMANLMDFNVTIFDEGHEAIKKLSDKIEQLKNLKDFEDKETAERIAQLEQQIRLAKEQCDQVKRECDSEIKMSGELINETGAAMTLFVD